ncbi:zinc finger protein CO3-like [Phoenix dactylifera]|uniref:Zinc finger protein CO3-like n=1 Tax=Phoenix dactylifera TaxID=42345 RepID=A0A8B7CEJ9_PHODC|nr:zinc finger protein CO3-like [Phoenix dactylifera]
MNDMLKVEGDPVGGGWAPRACESCRSAPCAVYCQADAAALCAACDADIHSANLLARRHHRVPVLPVSAAGFVVRPSLNHCNHVVGPDGADKAETELLGEEEEAKEEEEDDDVVSWMLHDPLINSNQSGNGLFGEEVDGFLDLNEHNSGAERKSVSQKQQQQQQLDYNNGKSEESEYLVPNGQQQQQQQHSFPMLECEGSSKAGFNNFGYSASLSHSLSLSSMEASIVPDTTVADISNSHLRPAKGTIDLFSGPAPQFTPMDREAKVLRYREKRKTRKFEKTIRYASRKAYAETRPRIKGRFVKRSDVELEVDQLFSTTMMTDSSNSIVPSF